MAAIVSTIAYHRNGVSGDPFYVALIDDFEEGLLVAIMPSDALEDERQTADKRCYVLNLETLKEGIVAFFANSYRGDHYYQLVRDAAQAHNDGVFENAIDAVDPTESIREALEQSGLFEQRSRPSGLAERVS